MEQKSYVFKFFIMYSFWNSEISAFYKLFEEMSRQLEGLRNEKCNLKKLLTPLWQILWKSEATLSYFEPQETSELVESLTLENSKAKDGKSLACCYNNINLATFFSIYIVKNGLSDKKISVKRITYYHLYFWYLRNNFITISIYRPSYCYPGINCWNF